MNEPLPFVSVLMPVRNEADFIAEALDAVVHQDYPRELLEIVVCDGMSTDSTRDIVMGFQRLYSNIKLLDNPALIAPSAMNIAAAKAVGTVLVRVDGHCRVSPTYVSRCVCHLRENPDVWGVGGPLETIGLGLVAESIAVAMSSRFGVGGSAFRTAKGRTMFVDTVAFPAYRRDAMKLAGPYDEQLVRNQDDEYNYRLRKLGGQILLAQDVLATYYSRGSFSKLWRQYLQYGFYKVRVMQLHPRQMSPRQFVPAMFVLALIISSLAAPLTLLPLSVVLCSYLLASGAATLLTCSERGWKHVYRLPVAFAALHLSYGLGFLAALCAFCVNGGTFASPMKISSSR